MLELKESFKTLTGEDLTGGNQKGKKKVEAEKPKPAAVEEASGDGDSREVKKITR